MKNSFTIEELPGLLYQKLDYILAGTRYRSLYALAGSSYEQIVLVSENELDLWLDINDGTEDDRPNGTMDLYHIKLDDQGDETRIPHLRFFCDILFGEMKIRYLQQPEISLVYTPNQNKDGELGSYLYTLGWLVNLESKDYR